MIPTLIDYITKFFKKTLVLNTCPSFKTLNMMHFLCFAYKMYSEFLDFVFDIQVSWMQKSIT